MNQRERDLRMLAICKQFSGFSTCMSRHVGCVIISERRSVLSTGYNGAPRGCAHGEEAGCECQNQLRIRGTSQELLRCAHAEANAIAQAAAEGTRLGGGTMYCTTSPCSFCAKMIINAGIIRVVFSELYPDILAGILLGEAKIAVEQVS